MDKRESFGQWLRHRRRELDLTQEELARQTGCARITIRKLEGGQMRPSKELALLLLERLDIPLQDREGFVRFARGGPDPIAFTRKFPPNNIPIPISSFVGRERELIDVRKLLHGSRLVTVAGPAGIGKTRFCLQAAGELLDMFDDGIWWVELAAIHDPALVMGSVAQALGVREIPQQSLDETLVHFLRTKQLLIVLDNCEHLIEACAILAEKLLTSCRNLKIMATSREDLMLTGEIVYRMSPLSMPAGEASSLSESLLQYEAILLFVQRANAVNRHFSLNANNASAVLQICRHLDGIPLAIELAAARVKTLSPGQIAARLDDRFSLLTGGSRTAPSRLQTLHAALDWSHDLLTETEKDLFRQLPVFKGGFSLEAIESVGSLYTGHSILSALSRIVDKSLVVVHYHETPRYALLETVSEYAMERLQESGEVQLFRDRHLYYFWRFSEKAEPHLFGSGQKDWADHLELEHNNLRAALTWALESDQIRAGHLMAGALARFWLSNGYLSEGRQWLEKMIEASEGSHTIGRAKLLHQASILSRYAGDHPRAKKLADQSINLYRNLGDSRGMGLALIDLGALSQTEGDREDALDRLEEGLQLLQSCGDAWGMSYAHVWLGDTWLRLGDTKRAAYHWEASLNLNRHTGDDSLLAWSMGGLADVARIQGEYERAVKMHKEALQIYQKLGNKSEPPYALEGLGYVAAVCGQLKRAVLLWSAASAWREAINEPLPSSYKTDYAPYITQVRGQLGEKGFEEVWSQGFAMSPEQAIEYALEA